MKRIAGAAALLVFDHTRRLLREGLVVRSVVFPIVLVVATITITVAVVVATRLPGTLAVTPGAEDAALRAAIEADGHAVIVVDDPGAAVRDGDAQIGTDGATLWVGAAPVGLEHHVRAHLGTVWRPDAPRADRRRAIAQDERPTRGIAVFLGVVFTLYGVVVGAGALVRDRDEGTLDAELSLPVPHVVQGLARWLAASLVLGGAYAYAVVLVASLMGLRSAPELAAHGFASVSTGAALGLAAAASAGRQRGFAGAMSLGLVGTFLLWGVGLSTRALGLPVPVASLLSESADPALPLVLAAGIGAAAALVFARRTAVA